MNEDREAAVTRIVAGEKNAAVSRDTKIPAIMLNRYTKLRRVGQPRLHSGERRSRRSHRQSRTIWSRGSAGCNEAQGLRGARDREAEQHQERVCCDGSVPAVYRHDGAPAGQVRGQHDARRSTRVEHVAPNSRGSAR
ncbi:hypothetical protein PybrP1_005981 [[Pythium] brassicae (nom. inval.)]|nr:hypothetical protein PybrP1_005981 [[Pythium] brassicae (nom. inval.)]